MEEEPLLLPRTNSRLRKQPPPPPLFILPRNYNSKNNNIDDASLPIALTPSQLKDRLIFGPSPRNTPPILDTQISPSSSAISSENSSFLDQIPQQPPLSPLNSWFLESQTNCKKQCLHRSKTAPAMAIPNDVINQPIPKPQFGTQSIVHQAVLLLFIYLLFGATIYWFNRNNFSANETHPVVDALYFCIVTLSTIGYGDITPNTVATKLFSILFVLIGFGLVDILLSGMVSYVLDLQENHLLRTVQQKGAGKKDAGKSYIIDVKKGRMRIRMKVGLALGVVVLCIGIGGVVMHFLERLGWVDSFYLSVMSVTTVGYGDRAFTTLNGRMFAVIWLLVSTLAVARAFLFLAEARVDKRHREMAKWVLSHNMTVSEFFAADMDNNGCVSKSEYVIYKLKEMGKIVEKDVMQVCEQFDRLDSGNCGKITIADLMEGNN